MADGQKVVYISGPYRAATLWQVKQNIEAARRVALKYWLLGYAVICPHANSAFMDGVVPDEAFLHGDLTLLERSDVIVMMPGWATSAGACGELCAALKLRIQVIYEACSELTKEQNHG